MRFPSYCVLHWFFSVQVATSEIHGGGLSSVTHIGFNGEDTHKTQIILSSPPSTLQMFGPRLGTSHSLLVCCRRSSRQHSSPRAGHRRRCDIDWSEVPQLQLMSSSSVYPHFIMKLIPLDSRRFHHQR